eukprot:TRINITY_DN88013_c0_g1_i1.p2 TRINITY_DN88013_c0_g1~~TRINITY_DN88013_c0_g1_i1.p2  ORF type:complete len:131 (+),score=3.63 TRINITY_DN88013_c0_g1_i1:310-702(+)
MLECCFASSCSAAAAARITDATSAAASAFGYGLGIPSGQSSAVSSSNLSGCVCLSSNIFPATATLKAPLLPGTSCTSTTEPNSLRIVSAYACAWPAYCHICQYAMVTAIGAMVTYPWRSRFLHDRQGKVA